MVNRGAGSKSYSSPRKYSVQYGMSVTVNATTAENTLYLWMPRILPTAEQRTIEAVAQDPQPLLDTTEASLYSFSNLQKGGKYRITLSWMFDRYAVATQVNPGDVPPYAHGIRAVHAVHCSRPAGALRRAPRLQRRPRPLSAGRRIPG